MKILVVGCGSIGRRHINNLVKRDDIESVFVYTKFQNCLEVLDNTRGKIRIVEDLGNIQAEFALICNETHKHVDTAILLAERGIDLFIEKPLSHNLEKLNKLKEIVRRRKIKLTVGYNLRFLGAIKYIKELLAEKIVGEPYFARLEVGQYLPQWRKGRDYRESYSASRTRGGGVALDLSHEIDYMRYLFGDPVRWKVIKTKVSELEIDSDDIFEGLYLYDNNFICSVHLDYLQRDKKRKIHIIGSRGSLDCDLVKKEIRITKEEGRESAITDSEYFNIDRTYIEEINHFIDSLKNDSSLEVTLDDGIRVLELLEENV